MITFSSIHWGIYHPSLFHNLCFIKPQVILYYHYKLNIEEGEFEKKDIITYNIFQVLGNAVAWLLVAPALDVIIYSEPMNVVIAQGVIAFVMDALVAGIVGTLLLIAYSKTKTKKGSLSRE